MNDMSCILKKSGQVIAVKQKRLAEGLFIYALIYAFIYLSICLFIYPNAEKHVYRVRPCGRRNENMINKWYPVEWYPVDFPRGTI